MTRIHFEFVLKVLLARIAPSGRKFKFRPNLSRPKCMVGRSQHHHSRFLADPGNFAVLQDHCLKKKTLVQVKSCLYDFHSQILVGGLGVGFECGVGQVGSGVGDVSWHRNGDEWHGGAMELNFSTLPEDRDVSNPFPGAETNSLPSQSGDTQRNCPVSPIPKAQAEPTRFWALLTLNLSSFLHPCRDLATRPPSTDPCCWAWR